LKSDVGKQSAAGLGRGKHGLHGWGAANCCRECNVARSTNDIGRRFLPIKRRLGSLVRSFRDGIPARIGSSVGNNTRSLQILFHSMTGIGYPGCVGSESGRAQGLQTGIVPAVLDGFPDLFRSIRSLGWAAAKAAHIPGRSNNIQGSIGPALKEGIGNSSNGGDATQFGSIRNHPADLQGDRNTGGRGNGREH
jgi:hypothetical protein